MSKNTHDKKMEARIKNRSDKSKIKAEARKRRNKKKINHQTTINQS